MKRSFIPWVAALPLSTIFIWIVSIFCHDTIAPWQWSAELKKYIHPEGHIHYSRSEGWGKSVLGACGVAGIPDIRKYKDKKIALWGDSYIVAWHVDDKHKAAQVLTRLLKDNKKEYLAFGVGREGAAIADYYFDLPKYEKKITGIVAHVIVITNLKEDLGPNMAKKENAAFVYSPFKKELVESRWEPRSIQLKKIIHDVRADFIWSLVKRGKDHKLRLLPNRALTKDKKRHSDIYDPESAILYLLSSMRNQSSLPIIFVYAPEVPKISDGKIIYSTNTKLEIELLSRLCSPLGIGLLDVSQKFVEFHKKTNKFPRGFNNSAIGKGHFNKHGHAIVAESIFEYLIEQQIITN